MTQLVHRGVAAAALLLLPTVSLASTPIAGNIGSAIWTTTGSPYIVAADATVQAGAVLTIEEGVEVRFATSEAPGSGYASGKVELIVHGTLDVQGTVANPVVFQGDTSTSTNAWYGIVLASDAEGATIAGANIRHASYGVRSDATAAVSFTDLDVRSVGTAGIYVTGGTPTITGLTVAGSGGHGIHLDTSGFVTVTDCLIYNASSYGVYLTNSATGSATFSYCTFDDNTYGFYADTGVGTQTYTVTNSIITNSDTRGLYNYDAESFSVSYSILWENNSAESGVSKGAGIIVANPLFADAASADFELTHQSPGRFSASDGTSDLGAVPYDTAQTPGLYGTLWSGMTLGAGTHVVAGDLTVPPTQTLTLEAGAHLQLATTDLMRGYRDPARIELRVQGAIDAQGTDVSPVVVDSIGSSRSAWWGIDLQTSATGSIVGADLSEAYYGLYYDATADVPATGVSIHDVASAGVYVRTGKPTLSGLDITKSSAHGIHLDVSGYATVSDCLLYQNGSYGVYLTNTSTGAATFDHCTVWDNSYGFYADTGAGTQTYTVTNSIVTDQNTRGLYNYDAESFSVSYSILWENNSAESGVSKGAGIIVANPLFSDPTAFDFELTHQSPGRFSSSNGTSDLGAVPFDTAQTPGLYGTLWSGMMLGPGTHAVAGDLTVPPGESLTLQPGAHLQFTTTDIMKGYEEVSKAELRVLGTLWSLGQPSNPVLMDSTGSAKGSWRGVHLYASADGGLLEHLVIDEAMYGLHYEATASNPATGLRVTDSSLAGIYVSAGRALLNDVSVTRSSNYGLLADGSGAVTADGCLFHGNSGPGVYLGNTSTTTSSFDFCTVYGNSYAFHADTGTGTQTYTVTNSVVTNNATRGFYNYDAESFSVSHSILWLNNSADSGVSKGAGIIVANPLFANAGAGDFELTHQSPGRFSAGDGTSDLGAIPFATALTPGLYGTLWSGMTLPAGLHAIGGDLTVPPGQTLTLQADAHLRFATSDVMQGYDDVGKSELRVLGTLDVQGSRALPVTLDSASTARNAWYGVHFYSGASGGGINGAHIEDAIYGIHYGATADNPITGTVINNVATAGVLVDAGFVTLDGVRISQSTNYGVELSGSGETDLVNCLLWDNGTYGLYFHNGSTATSTVTNCTIDSNDYGLYADTGVGTQTYTFRNTAITNSSVRGMYNYDAESVSFSYGALFNNNSADSGVSKGAGIVTSNPLYLGATDFHLQASSPLVDAGTATGAPVGDVDGRTRPVDGDLVGGAAYDIGAYEFQNIFPGIEVDPGAVTVLESGTQQVFDAWLASQPVGDVILAVSSGDTSEATVDKSQLVFTSGDWDVPQAITVTGVDDDRDDGDVVFAVTLNPSGSVDLDYKVVAPATVAVTTINDDFTQLLVSPLSGLTVSELATADSFTVRLGSEPSLDVRVDVTAGDSTEGSRFPPVLTFDSNNWDIDQTVTITGVNDALPDGDITWQVRLSTAGSGDGPYKALTDVFVEVTTLDDETGSPGVTVVGTTVTTSEAAVADTFSVFLDSPPAATVSIAVASDNPSEAVVDVVKLDFDASNWSIAQVVTVTGVDDAIDDGNQPYTITLGPITSADGAYAVIDPTDVSGTNTDDDTRGITVSKAAVATGEDGTTDAFTVVLDSEPLDNVTIAIASDTLSEATVDRASLTFLPGNWFVAQTVVVDPVDDALDDGDQNYLITIGPVTSNDAAYAALDPADLTGQNIDDDGAGLLISKNSVSTTEAAGFDTFTIALLSQPSGTVTIALASSDPAEATVSPAQLVFSTTDWQTAQTVTVTGVDDDVDDGPQSFSVEIGPVASSDSAYDGTDPADLPGTNADDDTAGIVIVGSGLSTTESGGTDTFTVALAAQPAVNLVVPIGSTDPGEVTVSPVNLSFTTTNWADPQTVTVTGVDDPDVDGEVAVDVWVGPITTSDAAYNTLIAVVVATNIDNDAATISVTPTSGLETSEGGLTDSFDVVLSLAPSSSVVVGVSVDDPTEGSLTITELTFTPSDFDQAQTVTVTGLDDGVVDGDVIYTVVLAAATGDAAYLGFDPPDVEVTNLDDDDVGLDITPLQGLSTTEAGGTDTFTVVLVSQPSASVEIDLVSDDPSEGVATPARLTFTDANWHQAQTVTVTGVDDDVDDDDVAYAVTITDIRSADAAYDDLVALDPDDVLVTNADDDTAGVFVAPSSGLVTSESGASDGFSVALLSAPTQPVTIYVATTDPTEGTVAPSQVVFDDTTWSTPQVVTVTGEDDLVDDGDIAFTVRLDPAYSLDPLYFQLDPDDVGVTNLDDDEPVVDTGDTGDTGDSGDTGLDTGPDTDDTDPVIDDGGSCGCASRTGLPGAGWLLLVAGLLAVKRRR